MSDARPVATVKRRSWIVGLAALAVLAVPSPVLGHELVGRMESPLPLAAYLAAAAIAVALSFAFVLMRNVPPPASRPPRLVRAPHWLVLGVRAVGLVAWLWVAAQAIVGGSSAASVAPLFLWVYGWVGVAIVSAFVGPVWTWLDPFSTLFDIGAAAVRRLGLAPWRPAEYPAWLGAWPAAIGLAFFIALELVYRGTAAGLVLIGYTALTLLAMANYGRDVWRSQGETFTVWFGLLNRIAPFGPSPRGDDELLVRRRFGSGLAGGEWSTALLVMVAIGVASILFDGLSQTGPWLDAFGYPSIQQATIELVVFLGLVVGFVVLVARYVGVAAVGAGLLPISIGYLVAHYLTYLVSEGQLIVVALTDPLQLGWDLIGTAYFEPGVEWIPPVVVWGVMIVGVVGGHMLGAWAGHAAASRTGAAADGGVRRNARRRQVPLAVLMVCLTATTLWSLGQAVVKESPAQGASQRSAGAAAPTPARNGPPEWRPRQDSNLRPAA